MSFILQSVVQPQLLRLLKITDLYQLGKFMTILVSNFIICFLSFLGLWVSSIERLRSVNTLNSFFFAGLNTFKWMSWALEASVEPSVVFACWDVALAWHWIISLWRTDGGLKVNPMLGPGSPQLYQSSHELCVWLHYWIIDLLHEAWHLVVLIRAAFDAWASLLPVVVVTCHDGLW